MTHSSANWKQDYNMGIGGNKSVILVTLYIDGSEPEMMMKMPLLHTTYVRPRTITSKKQSIFQPKD